MEIDESVLPLFSTAFVPFRTLFRFWWMPSSTVDPVRTPHVSVVPVLLDDRLLMCLPSDVLTRPSGSCVLGLGRPPSGTSRPLLSVWLTSWSMLPRLVCSRSLLSLSLFPLSLSHSLCMQTLLYQTQNQECYTKIYREKVIGLLHL